MNAFPIQNEITPKARDYIRNVYNNTPAFSSRHHRNAVAVETETRMKQDTGKSLSEALIFASTNPQYDDILFIEWQVQYVKIPSSEHGENMLCKVITL